MKPFPMRAKMSCQVYSLTVEFGSCLRCDRPSSKPFFLLTAGSSSSTVMGVPSEGDAWPLDAHSTRGCILNGVSVHSAWEQWCIYPACCHTSCGVFTLPVVTLHMVSMAVLCVLGYVWLALSRLWSNHPACCHTSSDLFTLPVVIPHVVYSPCLLSYLIRRL